MRVDSICLASTPYEEDCVQVSQEKPYRKEMLAETLVWKHLLERKFSPKWVKLRVVWSPHDFGDYCELHCIFDGEKRVEREEAYWIEDNIPARWDAEALEELKKVGLR